MAQMFTDADLRNWVRDIALPDGPMSRDAEDALTGILNARYGLVGPLTGNRTTVDDIPEDELWALVDKITTRHPHP